MSTTNPTPNPEPKPPASLTPEEIAERIAQQTAPQTTQPEPLDRDFSVVLETGQTYKAKTKDELIQQLVKAQENASKRIRELSSGPATQQQVQQAQAEPTFDTQKYYQMLADNPIAAQSYALQFTPEAIELRNQMEQISQFNTVLQEQTAVNQFKAETPDFPVEQNVANKFEEVWNTFNLPITTANLKLVHAYCLREKVYEPYQQQVQQPIQQYQPIPSLSGMPAGGQATQQIDPNTMTTEQLAQVIKALNRQ